MEKGDVIYNVCLRECSYRGSGQIHARRDRLQQQKNKRYKIQQLCPCLPCDNGGAPTKSTIGVERWSVQLQSGTAQSKSIYVVVDKMSNSWLCHSDIPQILLYYNPKRSSFPPIPSTAKQHWQMATIARPFANERLTAAARLNSSVSTSPTIHLLLHLLSPGKRGEHQSPCLQTPMFPMAQYWQANEGPEVALGPHAPTSMLGADFGEQYMSRYEHILAEESCSRFSGWTLAMFICCSAREACAWSTICSSSPSAPFTPALTATAAATAAPASLSRSPLSHSLSSSSSRHLHPEDGVLGRWWCGGGY